MTPTDILNKHCTTRPMISVQVNAAMEELRVRTWNEALAQVVEDWEPLFKRHGITKAILNTKMPER